MAYIGVEWKYLSFRQTVESLQFVFIPLDLQLFENLVMSYRINPSFESFLSFSSRIFRHLLLCSRLKAAEDRSAYVERHRAKILKQNLPRPLLEEVERKESIYRPFSSSELLDHVVTYMQHSTFDGREVADAFEQYKVFGINQVKHAEPGRLRNSFKDKDYSEGSQKKEPKDFSDKSVLHPSIRAKFDKLASFGIDTRAAPVCFMCMGHHLRKNCSVYPRTIGYADDDSLCTKIVNDKLMVFGFHPKESCKHNSRSKDQGVVANINPDSLERNPPFENWRPYKE